MQKKVLLLPAFVGVLLSGCSDDSSDRNPIDANSVPIIGEQSDSLSGLDPNIPYVDPVSGDTVAIPATLPLSSGAIAIPASSATAQLSVNQDSTPEVTPATSVSSTAQPVSSSSGLKDYEDNHKPKESFLPKAGFYSNLTIEPPTPKKGGEIRCTFDGSFPTQGSEQITQTKQITENTVIRCSEFVNGLPADTTTQTYFINETVSMSVVALTVNHHDMFDSTDGLYATGPLTNNGGSAWDFGGNANVTDNNNPRCIEPCKAANFWKDTELPVHVEYFENGSSTTEKTWEIDAGISIIGNYSRYKPKKSVAIKMDNDNYGDKVLKYSLFTTRPEAKKIKSFNLRNNGNRFWTDYIGDAMMTSLMEGTDVDYQRSRQVVVFYNGEYFGIHDLRERLNRSYVETNYGINSKSINMIKIAGSSLEASGTNGASTGDYQQLVNEISSANYAGENNQQYKQLKTKMNVNSFAQYMLAEMYFHNGDWPNNNVRAWGGNGNPFKFVAFDTDHGFGFTPGIANFDVQNQNMFDWVLGAKQGATQNPGQGGMWGGFGGGSWGATDSRTPGGMLKKLLDNPDFKRMFINNACILLNDYLTYEKVQKTVQAMMATIPTQEQSRDQERWPRNQSNFTWDPSGNTLIAYARNRSETVRQEMADRFDLQNEVNVTIAASGNGTIKVDGMKLPSANYQGKFFAGMQMQLEALPAAGRIFSGWSDGVAENPRLVEITDNMNITAQFK
ncbi:CotH kinase family protein [Fibrobacter sp.]|uniref:CotH kinase family protein n=1 Tax=Fibrobacter sp. TaxID=35828 RepID=UPI0026373A65|nr:CotH kinase family protein [Fibrobacter sp.]MDD5943864.1 CotH kinase family protein [Fibrobacter sp.]